LGNFSRLILIAEETEVGGFILNDLDGDGDADIAMTFDDNGIQWIENLDGQGTFGNLQTIDPIDFASVITSADFDGDGDIDLAALSITGAGSDLIAWYENTDGQGTFGPPKALTYSLDSIDKISEADFDGDGDLDIFVFAMDSDSLLWFENLDGQGNFGNFQTIAVSNDINN